MSWNPLFLNFKIYWWKEVRELKHLLRNNIFCSYWIYKMKISCVCLPAFIRFYWSLRLPMYSHYLLTYSRLSTLWKLYLSKNNKFIKVEFSTNFMKYQQLFKKNIIELTEDHLLINLKWLIQKFRYFSKNSQL